MLFGKTMLLSRALGLTRIPELYWGLVGVSRRLPVLAYHRIYEMGNEDEFPYDPELVSATPEDFAWQMEFVHRHFDVITFERLIASIERTAPLPRHALIITFDDGHRDNHEHAFPVLRRLRLPATIFLSTAYIGGQRTFWFDRVSYLLYHAPPGTLALRDIAYSAELADVRSRRAAANRLQQILKRVRNEERLQILKHMEQLVRLEPQSDAGKSGALSWAQVREMSEAGIEFGSHSVTHPVLTMVEDAVLERELRDSRRAIEQETGKACQVIAYPIGGAGAFDDRVMSAARKAGYRLGLTYVSGTNTMRRFTPFAMRRLHVERYTSRAAFQSMLGMPAVFWSAMKHGRNRSALRGAPRPTQLDEAIGSDPWDMLRQSGWQYLLDLRRSDSSVLCLDCTGGATALLLSGLFRRVTVIHPHARELERIERRLELAGAAGASCRIVRNPAELCALEDRPYDGIVIHDLGATVVRRTGSGEDAIPLEDLLTAVRSVLAPEGFAYVGMRNRHSYVRVRDGWRNAADRRLLTPHEGKRALVAAGFGSVASYPLLLEGARITELIPGGGYCSAYGSVSFAEKFKQLALNRWSAPHFAPGYGLVAHKGAAPRPSVLDRLLDGFAEYGLPISPGRHELKRYLVLNWGKVILSMGQGASPYGEYVLILTGDGEPKLRRRREAKVLRALSAQPVAMARYIPRDLGEFSVDGASCFVMREIPGISIDQPLPWLEELTQQATDLIARFHAETRCAATIDEAGYARLFGRLFRDARARNAPVVRELTSLEGAIRALVMGTEIPAVWVHGDYKIENLIFDGTTRELLGVIDWELSEENGLPLIDLLYLLLYNRTLREGVDLLTALGSLVLGGSYESERIMFARYVIEVPLSPRAQEVLQAMFFVHHIAVRYQFTFDSEEEVNRVRETLGLLERATGAGHLWSSATK